jgi:hypothetical protein
MEPGTPLRPAHSRCSSVGRSHTRTTIQTTLGELEAAGLAAGSEEGNGRARYWSPTTPNPDADSAGTVKRAMVGERAWHDPPGNVVDRGLAEPAHGTSDVALVASSSLTSEWHQERNALALLGAVAEGAVGSPGSTAERVVDG